MSLNTITAVRPQGPNPFRILPREVLRVILGKIGPRPDTWRGELLSLVAVDTWANAHFRPMMEVANLKALLQRLEAIDAQSDLYCARYQHAIKYLEDRTALLQEEPYAFQDSLFDFIRLIEKLPEDFRWKHFCFLCSLTPLLEDDFSTPILIGMIESVPVLPWYDWEPGRKEIEAQKLKLSADHQAWIEFAAQSMDLKFEGRAAALKWPDLLKSVAGIESDQWRAGTAHEVIKRFGPCSWMPALVKQVLEIADSLPSGKAGLLQYLAKVQHEEVCRLLGQGVKEEDQYVAASTKAMLASCQHLGAGQKAPLLDAIVCNLSFSHVAPLPMDVCGELIECCLSLKEVLAGTAVAGKCIELVCRWAVVQPLLDASTENAEDLRQLLLQYGKGQPGNMDTLGAAFAVALKLQADARIKVLPSLWKVVKHKVKNPEAQRKLVSRLGIFLPNLRAPLGQEFLMQLLFEMNRLQLAFDDRELARLVSGVAGLPPGDERKSGLKLLIAAALSRKSSQTALYDKIRTELDARAKQPQAQEMWEDLWNAVLELAKRSKDEALHPLLELVAVSAITSAVPAINTARIIRMLGDAHQLPAGCQAKFALHLAGTVNKAEHTPAAKAVSMHCAGLPCKHQPAIWSRLALSECRLYSADFMAASKAVGQILKRAKHSGVCEAELLHGMADILNSEDFSAVLLHKLIRLTGLLDKADRAAVLKKAIAAVTTSLSVLESRRSIAGYGPAKLQEIGLKFAAVREEAFAALLKALKALAKTGIDVATLSSLLEQMADLVKQLRSELQFDSGERLLKLAAAVSIQCQASVAARLPWK